MERMLIGNPTTSLGGLVLEQDFILHLRHLQKQSQALYVVNAQYANMPGLVGKSDLVDATHDRLHDVAKRLGAELYLMSNGDAFVVVDAKMARGEDPLPYGEKLIRDTLPNGIEPGRSALSWLEVYRLPDEYGPLREKADHYINLAKAVEAFQADTPEVLLQEDHVRGPLTAYSLSQIERLLDDLDVRRYVKTQRIYERDGGKYFPVYEENYISTRDLQQEKFPRLELRASGRLFAELASLLDRRTLSNLIRTHDAWRGRDVGMNLSAGTVLSSTFAQFCHIVHGDARKHVFFELHISELLHDLDKFMNAVELLAQEGFNVAIDGITIQMLPYLRLAQIPARFFKVSVDEAGVRSLADPAKASLLKEVPAEKLIFMHVDSPDALSMGEIMGVTHYQGFLIDEMVAKGGAKAI